MDNERDIERFVSEEIDRPRQGELMSLPLRRQIVKALLDGSKGMYVSSGWKILKGCAKIRQVSVGLSTDKAGTRIAN
jgi:hypothetical protein